MASPVFEQLVAIHAMERLEEILAERRALLRRRYDTLARALADQLPDWRWNPPSGGLVIWAELPQPISTSLAIEARRHGVHLAPGPRFGAAHLLERFVRLPFTEAPDRLERAIATLAELTPGAGAVTDEPEPVQYVVLAGCPEMGSDMHGYPRLCMGLTGSGVGRGRGRCPAVR
ncbi:MAG: hypothetical protein M0Z42_06760 [Actinomycetota bacterium]|nr:hypothetical protein [Actinomycetota bacterium]